MPVNITEAEWEVMRVLWAGEPMTADAIIRKLKGKVDWKPKTVKSLISRLAKKKAIRFTQDGREYIYTSLVSESMIVREETRSFLNRVFGGSLTPMIARLAEDGDLSKDDVAELRKILSKHGKRRP